ncbi:MAG: hypothetical protein OQJ89_03730 [Kangiellaceae bacterium]|nr:hypothetical protein [Kangiellaceae bacterium]MCW9016049.1 hypothetical protein [Kangiellaceae bacterium]
MRLIKASLFFLACMLLAACSEGKYGNLTDAELREKKRHCDSIPKKSPVFATGCENIKKELKRRKDERKKRSKRS